MYQAKVDIVQGLETGVVILVDNSTGDEIPLTREVTLRDGFGKTYTYEFDFSNQIEIEDLKRDLAFSLDYTATPSSIVFGSKYNYRTAFITTGYSEDLLLEFQGEIHCNSSKDICNSEKVKELLCKSSEIISFLESAKLYISKCEVNKAQKLLNYLNDYRVPDRYKERCGCGCS